MEAVLEVKDLHVSFDTYGGKVTAVRGVSFQLFKGETLAIVGESGSGKSVTSKSLMRLIPSTVGRITKGEIWFQNNDIVQLTEKEMQKIRGSEISMIFQDPMTSLNPTMMIGKQISECLVLHQKLNRKEAKKRTIELLELVGITQPDVRYKQYPHQFSGGMRQRVVIAIALATNPKVLIADEPTTALDVTIQAQILDLLKELQVKMGTSIIFITHDLGVVANLADRVAVMYAGKIVEIGKVDEVFYNPQHPYTWGLLDSMPRLEQTNQDLQSIPGSPPDLMNLSPGDPFAVRNKYAMKIDFLEEAPLFKITESHYAATWLLHEHARNMNKREIIIPKTIVKVNDESNAIRSKLLQVNHLEQSFLTSEKYVIKAVNDVTFDIYKGETFGLVGESGSGKSTIGKTMIRLHSPKGGQVIYNGEEVHKIKSLSKEHVFNRKMQMIFQDPYSSLNPRMTVADIVAEGIDIHHLAKNYEERMEKVYELLKTVGLQPEHASRYPHEFSGGQRQRIGIARALSVEPEFIIADEPISALDVSIQAQIVNLLKKLQKEKGITYLFIAHDLSMVKYISDRIGVMYQGRLVELAGSDTLYENPIHPYTKSLLSAIPLPNPKIERNRKRLLFDGSAYNQKRNGEERIFREVSKDHWVSCTQDEFEQYLIDQKNHENPTLKV